MPHEWQRLLADILLTVAGSEKGKYSISWFESQQYPANFLPSLLNSGLIEEVEPAQTMICEGCEQYCSMRVESYPRIQNKPLQYFIFCDKSSSIGRISVDNEELMQWHISKTHITQFLIPHIAPKAIHPQNLWVEGVAANFNNKRGVFSLVCDETLDLMIGKEDKIPLIELIQWKKGIFSINLEELDNFANSALSPHASVSIAAVERAAKLTMLKIAKEAGSKKNFPKRDELWEILKKKHPDLIPAGYRRIRKDLPPDFTKAGR